MSSGDVGRFDDDGRLYVEGRDDEMIVSGGENVFPKEVEDCLARHEAVVEVAAIGVDDDDFGKRLRAFVVAREPAPATEDELKDWVQAEPRPLQGAARDRVPRRAAPQRDRQGAQARARPSDVTDGPVPDARGLDPRDRPSGSAGRRPTSRCATSSARTSRCRRSAGTQGGGAGLLPLRVLRRVHRRDGRHPRPARRVPDLRHRGPGDLLRPGLLAARLRRHRTGSTSRCSRDFWPHGEVAAAYGVFDAERASPAARRTSSTRRGSCAGRCTTRCPTARPGRAPGPSPRIWTRPAGLISSQMPSDPAGVPDVPVGTVLLVEPLVTRDASGSTYFSRCLRPS